MHDGTPRKRLRSAASIAFHFAATPRRADTSSPRSRGAFSVAKSACDFASLARSPTALLRLRRIQGCDEGPAGGVLLT